MNILIIFHTPINAGYAMAALERTFYEVALRITNNMDEIYFAFSGIDNAPPTSLPTEFENYFELNPEKLHDKRYFNKKLLELNSLDINFALCFDLQPSGKMVSILRKCHIGKIVSYWGSTMSSLNTGAKLLLKKIELHLSRDKPDLFIFESESMRHFATHGRGLARNITTVIPTGVDTKRLAPLPLNGGADVLDEFSVPTASKVAIYSGHMEERKGVHILIQAMKILFDSYDNHRWHFLICGNRPGEEQRFIEMLAAHPAKKNVTFCGYRNDLHSLMPACDIGLIASTGWDSFPMSALEMASCGLPIVVSALQGLTETLEDGVTGMTFEPGNSAQLAMILNELSSSDDRLRKMSLAARRRIIDGFSLENQHNTLETTIRSILNS